MPETLRRYQEQVESLEAQFDRVAAPEAIVRKALHIGGQRVDIVAASEQVFTHSCTALAHHECPPDGSDAALTITLWESDVMPFSLSVEEWNAAAAPWKNILGAAQQSDPSPILHFADHQAGQLSIFDPKTNRGYVVYRDLARMPIWERATPLRDLLNIWAGSHGGHLVHGAVVGNASASVLLAGKGGSGKSSTALGCLNHPDLCYLGDDVCMIQRDGGATTAYNLYHSAKLLPHDIEKHAPAGLEPIPDRDLADGKPTYFLWPEFQEKIAISRPLKAILLPVVKQQKETTFAPASPGDTWHALAPVTMSIMACDRALTFQWMAGLIRDVPAYELHLGSDRDLIPDVIHQFLLTDAQ